MELKNQLSNLELSTKLRDLDIKQNSIFYHNDGKIIFGQESIDIEKNYYSAFTVAELGVMLAKYGCYGSWETNKNKWAITEIFSRDYPNFDSDTEADARAKMLVYLLENNLTKL